MQFCQHLVASGENIDEYMIKLTLLFVKSYERWKYRSKAN